MKTTSITHKERKAYIQRRREAHHKALEILASEVGCKTSGLELWRRMRSIERDLYGVTLHYTNGEASIEAWELAKETARMRLQRLFGVAYLPKGVFLNGDPRGHMLKLDNDERLIPEGMEKDWGGNGILAAEIK